MKSSGAKDACYAEGGAVLGRTRDFMKTPDSFSAKSHGSGKTSEVFGKGSASTGDGGGKAPAAKDKSCPPIKPRS
jgi:hypothetical protein